MKSSVAWKENYFEPHVVMTNDLSSSRENGLLLCRRKGKIYLSYIYVYEVLGRVYTWGILVIKMGR